MKTCGAEGGSVEKPLTANCTATYTEWSPTSEDLWIVLRGRDRGSFGSGSVKLGKSTAVENERRGVGVNL